MPTKKDASVSKPRMTAHGPAWACTGNFPLHSLYTQSIHPANDDISPSTWLAIALDHVRFRSLSLYFPFSPTPPVGKLIAHSLFFRRVDPNALYSLSTPPSVSDRYHESHSLQSCCLVCTGRIVHPSWYAADDSIPVEMETHMMRR